MNANGSREALTNIRAITFDLDDTLFDFRGCMARSAEQVILELCRRHPHAAATATAGLFHELWSEATEEAQSLGDVPDWPAIRQRGIELLVLRCNCPEVPALAQELTALYFHHHRAPTAPFLDAAEAIPQLAARLPLGIISNAN